MERFPVLENNQVAVVSANVNSGHVLNLDLVPDAQNGKRIYAIFDNAQDAVTYAKSIITEKKNIECVIHGPDQETVHYITPKNVKHF